MARFMTEMEEQQAKRIAELESRLGHGTLNIDALVTERNMLRNRVFALETYEKHLSEKIRDLEKSLKAALKDSEVLEAALKVRS